MVDIGRPNTRFRTENSYCNTRFSLSIGLHIKAPHLDFVTVSQRHLAL